MLSISNHLILSAIWDKSAHLHEYYYHNNYPATAQTKRQMRTIGASCFIDSSQVIYMNKLEHELSISLDVYGKFRQLLTCWLLLKLLPQKKCQLSILVDA